MIIMMVGVIKLLFFVSSWIIIHLGRKPVNGGRPPMDNRVDDINSIRLICFRRGIVGGLWYLSLG